MRRLRLLPPAALALTTLLAACGDAGPIAPAAPATAAPSAGPAFDRTTSQQASTSTTVMVGDTAVTTFTVGTNALIPSTFSLGHGHRIDFPYAAWSICDVRTSTYGAGQWDAKCAPSKVSVTVTAKSWVTAEGLPATDFQPAMRFVPGLKRPVLLTLKDKAQAYVAGQQVLFCSNVGCVDESLTDPSVATRYDATNGFWERPLKHFSGYSVSVGRTDDGY